MSSSGGLRIDSWALASGLAFRSEASFREIVLRAIFEYGRSVPSYPFDKVMEACFWVLNSAAAVGKVFNLSNTSKRSRANRINPRETPSPHHPGKVPPANPYFLEFTGRRKGKGGGGLRGSSSELAKEERNSQDTGSSTDSTPALAPKPLSWADIRRSKNCGIPLKRSFRQIGPVGNVSKRHFCFTPNPGRWKRVIRICATSTRFRLSSSFVSGDAVRAKPRPDRCANS